MTDPRRSPPLARWLTTLVVVVIAYVLSCGPVLSTAFWLREHTGRDEFYAAIWLYAPLFFVGPDSLLARYIEWWCKLLHTVGPG